MTKLPVLKAAYSTQELANLSGLSRHQIRRLIEAKGLETLPLGRKVLVPLTSFQAAFPTLWRSILLRSKVAT